MHPLGYLLSILIGISLGLIGGGGSIMTVPVLVYVFGIKPTLATGYSLFIVGIAAFIGSIKYFNNKLISLQIAFYFSIPSLVAIAVTRKFLMPLVPEEIFKIGNFMFTKDVLILVVFAIIMIASAKSMIRSRTSNVQDTKSGEERHISKVMLDGLVVGFLTGFLGIGGGFLIIPVLVVLAKLPMKIAIGTSLLIIAINSFVGFSIDVFSGVPIDYKFLLMISLFSVSGIFIGFEFGKKIHGDKLKPAFGWFILAMGIYILVREIFLKN